MRFFSLSLQTRLRLNVSPPGNREVGGPGRECNGNTEAVSKIAGWMGVYQVFWSGSREARVNPPPGAVRGSTAERPASWRSTDGFLTDDLLLPNRLIRRVSPRRQLLVRFVGSLCSSAHSPLRAPTHTHTPFGSYLFPLADISERRIYVEKNIFSFFSRDCWILFSPLLHVVTAVAEALRGKNTWLPLSKRRSSFCERRRIPSFGNTSFSAWLSSVQTERTSAPLVWIISIETHNGKRGHFQAYQIEKVKPDLFASMPCQFNGTRALSLLTVLFCVCNVQTWPERIVQVPPPTITYFAVCLHVVVSQCLINKTPLSIINTVY